MPHIRAFLLQNYHQDCLPGVDPTQPNDLFSVLGTASNLQSGKGVLNFEDFKDWLLKNEAMLRARIASWIPGELSGEDRTAFWTK